MSKVSNKLFLHIGSEISFNNFSFSQLIIEVKRMFDTEGIPGFVRVLVILIESILIKSGVSCPRCHSERNHIHSDGDRKLKTSIGEVSLVLRRLKCLDCNKTFTPMMRLIDLKKYGRKSREFEKTSLETVTDQSFRRSVTVINKQMVFMTSLTTLHRWD